ncbi:MAG: hypothetical protein AAFR61_30405, partial [Bacteroidota bacterium]
ILFQAFQIFLVVGKKGVKSLFFILGLIQDYPSPRQGFLYGKFGFYPGLKGYVLIPIFYLFYLQPKPETHDKVPEGEDGNAMEV